jgi:lipopolysaccharide/colanic/teichoic acid biosynthesis glycosyltransferase
MRPMSALSPSSTWWPHWPAAKRLLDIVLSSLVLLVLAPILMLIIVMIRLDSPGPAFFRQTRVGKGGRHFTCLKFRTMRQNADQSVHLQAVQRFVSGQAVSDDPEARFKMTNDKRVTRIGALLRRMSLDELPQLINVLRGEMSLVGPRPAIPYELQYYKEWHHQRNTVQPGITGMWQVYGRSIVGFDESMTLDVRYVNELSFWLDVKLILLTIPTMLMQRGAR